MKFYFDSEPKKIEISHKQKKYICETYKRIFREKLILKSNFETIIGNLLIHEILIIF